MAKSNTGIAPPGYHQHYYSDRDWKAYSAHLAQVVKYSYPGPILDLGAGCGYFVEAAMRWGLQCTGVEGSEEGVSLAKQRVPDADIRHHKLSESLPFSDFSFQTVMLNQVIEHLEPNIVELTLKEAFRVMRPGGMILVTSPSKANKKEWLADPTHINLLSPTDLRLELAKCGFEKIVPFDSPLSFLGDSKFGRGMMFVVFKLLKMDILSATANAMAFKQNAK